MLRNKKVVIFGGLGYVGDPLIKLLKDDLNLTVVDPNWFKNEERYDNVKYIEKSSFEIDDIDADYCIYLAAVSNDPMGAKFASHTYLVNEEEALRIALLCQSQKQSTRFVFASSCSVYGSSGETARTENDEVLPLTDYAKSKINAEGRLKSLANDNSKIICLRFATACGASKATRLDLALNDFIITALSSKKIEVLSDGKPWRPFIHISDMALAIRHSLVAPINDNYDVFNVGSNEFTYRIKELAEKVAEFTKAEVSINEQNTTDARSYTVNFDKFTNWYQEAWPTMNLEATVEDLTQFYRDTIIKHGLVEFDDFRNSSKYCRLKSLQSQNIIATEK